MEPERKNKRTGVYKTPVIGSLLWSLRKRRLYRPKRLARQISYHEAAIDGLHDSSRFQNAKLQLQASALEGLLSDKNDVWAKIITVDTDLEEIRNRIEFMRLELMYEIQHRVETGGADEEDPTQMPKMEPKILNHERVNAYRDSGLALNLGCGHKPIDGMINVDMRALTNVDVQATADDLPFEKGSISRIHSEHLIEHFTEQTLLRRIFPHWFDMLKSGGTLSAVTPDAEAMMRSWADGAMDFETLRLITFGQQEYDGDFHFTMFSVESIEKLLKSVGFVDVECIAHGRPNGKCLEFEIKATRP